MTYQLSPSLEIIARQATVEWQLVVIFIAVGVYYMYVVTFLMC